MSFQDDPYRTLGVGPSASLNEIKSAYRRLVKKYHPDAAGERALPRFLAIQAAYERLVDGEGRLRPPNPGSGRGAARPGPEPWRADPARARASRDAWRARRSTGSARSSGASGPAGPTGPTTPRGESARARGPHREHYTRRGPRKATPGSTTYDEAAELPLDPEWEGGAWYGPSSGTYWTLNPREYADPRKHGPEYLARARRVLRGEWGQVVEDPVAASAPWPPAPSAPRPPVAPEPIARRVAPRSLLALTRERDHRWLLLLALIGWPPIGLAVGTLLGAVAGCSTASATCSGPVPLLTFLVQPLIVLALFLVPTAAAVAAFASLVALVVGVPSAVAAWFVHLSEPSVEGSILGVVIAIAYVIGLAVGVRAIWWVPNHDGSATPES